MKKVPEVNVGPLGVWMNYFQFQNEDTYNWNLGGFNDSLMSEF